MVKKFYLVSNELPQAVKSQIPADGFSPLYLNGQKYLPVYIGATEAKIMLDEKLFTRVGDTIGNFFGNRIIITGILDPTNTDYDNYHFVPAGFTIK
jgi:hypothetical protein